MGTPALEAIEVQNQTSVIYTDTYTCWDQREAGVRHRYHCDTKHMKSELTALMMLVMSIPPGRMTDTDIHFRTLYSLCTGTSTTTCTSICS